MSAARRDFCELPSALRTNCIFQRMSHFVTFHNMLEKRASAVPWPCSTFAAVDPSYSHSGSGTSVKLCGDVPSCSMQKSAAKAEGSPTRGEAGRLELTPSSLAGRCSAASVGSTRQRSLAMVARGVAKKVCCHPGKKPDHSGRRARKSAAKMCKNVGANSVSSPLASTGAAG